MGLDVIPRISVIVVTYNHEKYIGECLESLLAQTLMPVEIVICDDHSTENTWSIISEYKEKYPDLIKPYRHEQNIGMVKNSQFGRKMYSGELVSVIEGDDRWLSRKLECEWNVLRNSPEAAIAYSNVYTMDGRGDRKRTWYVGNGTPPAGDVFMEVVTKRFFPNVRTLFRNQLMYRSAFDEEGYCDESLESFWDWDMKIRMAARYRFAFSGEALVEYRQHSEGFSRGNNEKHFRAMVRIYEKYLPLLKRRSRSDEVWARFNIEGLIAQRQRHLKVNNQIAYYSARNVYERNLKYLNTLSKKERCPLERKLAPTCRELISQVLDECLESSERGKTLRYLLHLSRNNVRGLDLRSASCLLSVRKVRQGIMSVHRWLHGNA